MKFLLYYHELGMLPSGHFRDYYSGDLSCSQVSVTHLKIGTRRFHLRVPDLQMSYRDLTEQVGISFVVPVIVTRATCPIEV